MRLKSDDVERGKKRIGVSHTFSYSHIEFAMGAPYLDEPAVSSVHKGCQVT